ncbi:putative receptor protein kinase ZmPK1 [Hordeum vulgare]|nr:putative receptor protein kinase ZmPK1 [Hordeum vulgare]
MAPGITNLVVQSGGKKPPARKRTERGAMASRNLLIRSPKEEESSAAIREAVLLGGKNAAIAGTVVAVPTFVACRVLPWAKHNLNYTAQALIISTVTLLFIEVILIITGCWVVHKWERRPEITDEGYMIISSQFRIFSYKELQKVTNCFQQELGSGGSGAFYKGVLDDERKVAVKKLNDVIQGDQEFRSEISVMGRIYHMNLKNSHVLQWGQRYNIALRVAKGLAYLHHECLEWIVHCDVKPENILLDRDFQPKIADFGLMKLQQRGSSAQMLSKVHGTRGYIAPEWALSLPINGKADVYSYGVLLLS